ncbi:MAG: hypothetical protein IJW20_01280 [Clostridia bacterium]|nr:hypothetical protein [Clostridia bacterium]
MGTYYIPRNYRGESRILYIFTIKSLITTAVGAGLGAIFFAIFSMVNLKVVGIILMAIFAFIGYAIGALKIPTIVAFPITKKIGGEPIGEIILRYMKFKKNRKMYVYTKEEK